MAKLITNKAEFNLLISQGLLEIISNNPLLCELKLKTGLNNKPRKIKIECVIEDSDNENIDIEIVNDSSKSKSLITVSDDDYQKVKNAFPTLSEFKKLQPNDESNATNKRYGNDDSCKRSLSKLLQKFSIDEIINAVRYEVSNKAAQRKLQYMSGLQPWLNNTSNVEVVIEESKQRKNSTINNIKPTDKMI